MITKPAGTGGLVSVGTVTEQLLHEIEDPARYRAPDVDVDFTTLRLTENGPDRVAVRDATGRPPSDRLKLAIVYRDGWTASGMLAVVGRDAEKKARAAGAMLLERVRRAGFAFADSLGEIVAAWIVPRAGAALSPAAIQTYCRGQITHFKIPQHIAIVQSLPRTVTGKVRKHLLKAQAIAELGLGEVAAIQTA